MAINERILFMMLVHWSFSLCGCSERGNRTEEIAILQSVMPASLIEMSNLDVATRDSVAIVGAGESKHIGLRLFPAMPQHHGGIRSEISLDFPFVDGDHVTYRWRFMIPKGFLSDTPENRWWVIGQWHDQPNQMMAESWDDFESRSPPISLSIGEVDSQMVLGLDYGLTTNGNIQQQVGPLPITRGEWNTVEAKIHWTQGASGEARVSINGSSETTLIAKGPNMNNAFQHYLKVGMYRHPDIDTENWIYIDDFEIVLNAMP